MDELRSWAFSLCCAAAAGAMLSLLAPESSLGRVCRFAIRVFFLCCAVLPLRRMGQTLRILPDIQVQADYSAQEMLDVVSGHLEETAAGALEREAARCLEEEGIPYKKVTADVHVDRDNGISINCLRSLLPPEAEGEAADRTGPDRSDIAALIEAKTGVSVELTAENGGGSP